MIIVVASEHRGYDGKDGILVQVRKLGHEALDFGPFNPDMCDYPDFASKAALAVSDGNADRAILIGGTGIGMSIVANKFRGVRAALCHDDLSTAISRQYVDANILCLPMDLLSEETAARMVEVWLTTPFDGGHHARRVEKITRYEQTIREGKTISGNGKRP